MQRFQSNDGAWATGFRYDLPDDQGRIWRTEGVLRQVASDQMAILRMRGQCVASAAVARLQVPKRPHLIRSVIEQTFGGSDGDFRVTDSVTILQDTEDGQLLAGKIVEGSASQFLPVVYVSATGAAQWVVARADLDRLARDLAGIAHVVLEPNRDMSFRLRDLTNGRNAYGGTVGIAMPGLGLIRRVFLGLSIPDEVALLIEIKDALSQLRTGMGQQGGWDWLDLQEAAIHQERARNRAKLTGIDSEFLWQEEITAKDERIAELTVQLEMTRLTAAQNSRTTVPLVGTAAGLGPELYDGEFSDRLRSALQYVVDKGKDQGWDRRSLAAFKVFLTSIPASAQLDPLLEDLRRATGDIKRLAKAVPAFLEKVGYVNKSSKTHIRMEALPSHTGLDTVTVPKSASDHRSGENLKGHIIAALGLARLSR